MDRGIMLPALFRPVGDEFFVDAADEFQGDCVEGIERPKAQLATFDLDLTADEALKQFEMLGGNMPLFPLPCGFPLFFRGPFSRKQVAIESAVEPSEKVVCVSL